MSDTREVSPEMRQLVTELESTAWNTAIETQDESDAVLLAIRTDLLAAIARLESEAAQWRRTL